MKTADQCYPTEDEAILGTSHSPPSTPSHSTQKNNIFNCPDCGGSVEVRLCAIGPITYRGIEIKPPPIHLPICSQCGEQWLDKEATDRLHTALENTYAKVKQGK